MQVKTQVHEAVLDQVRPGLPATVKIDAFPDELHYAVVNDVAVVPSSTGYYSSGVKTYETVVHIDGEVENLKPGMTAVVEIHVDRIKDVLTIPVQAVVQREKDNWCYVDTGSGVERRSLDLGRSNDKFVQIQGGLGEGERIVLNPMTILEEIETQENQISPEIGEPDEMPETVARSLKKQGEEIMAERAQAAKARPVGAMKGPGGGLRGPAGMTKGPGGPARGGARPASAPGGPRPKRSKAGQRKPPQAAGVSTVAPISKAVN
jgi:hypothetical protein